MKEKKNEAMLSTDQPPTFILVIPFTYNGIKLLTIVAAFICATASSFKSVHVILFKLLTSMSELRFPQPYLHYT